jgi:hypothetical protein
MPEERSISAEERRMLASSIIYSGVQKGYSGAEILRALRMAGYGYRTEDFYRDYHMVAARVQAERVAPRVSDFSYPPLGTKIPSLKSFGAKYRIWFRLDTFDPVTKELKEINTSVKDDVFRPIWQYKQQIRDKAEKWVDVHSIPEIIGIHFIGWEEGR